MHTHCVIMRIPISERLVNVVKASSICSLLVSMKNVESIGKVAEKTSELQQNKIYTTNFDQQ